MTPVKIKSISITDIGFVVFLKGEEEDRVLPIFIGPVEAQAISMILLKTASKRPMTHELLYNLLN
ncbi:MAG: bifunctional nuclease family protein, partial [Spirochaetia bacterium]|nr:bifunctional nuclease family protein [Spirochaetia bacterium]